MDNPFAHLSKNQKYMVIGGSILVLGGFEFYHHSSTGSWNPFSGSTSSSTSTTGGTASASAIDPVTGLPTSEDNSVDPETGLTYLAEAEEYGSVSAAEADVSQYGTTTASGTGYTSGVGTDLGTLTTTSTGSLTTADYSNAQSWAQAATTGLAEIGYSETDVATALADVMNGIPVTATQASYWNTAVAEYPYPGTPPNPILAPTTTPAAPATPVAPSVPATTTKTSSSTATSVVGKAVSGLKVSSTTAATKGSNGKAVITWDKLTGATSYEVYMEVNGAHNVSSTSYTETGLAPGSHEVMVTPEPAGKGTSVAFTISKAKDWKE